MASAGTLIFDAKIDTSGLKKQLNNIVSKSLNINLKINTNGFQNQLNQVTKTITNTTSAIQNNTNANNKNSNGINKSINTYVKWHNEINKALQSVNKLSTSYSKIDKTNNSSNLKKRISILDEQIKKNNLVLKSTNAMLEADKKRNNLSNSQKTHLNEQKASLEKWNNELIKSRKEMYANCQAMISYENYAKQLSNVFNKTSQIISSIGSGGNIIQTMTSLGQTIGGTLSNAIGTAISGNPIIGQAASNVVSSIVGILGNIVNLVANIVKTTINISLKIVRTGINAFKKIVNGLINVIKDLPSTLETIISKIGNISTSFKILSTSISYAKNILTQFLGIISQKFSAYGIISFIKDSFELGSSLTEQYHILKVVTPSFVEYQDVLSKTSQYSEYMSSVTEKLGISTINATKYIAGYASMWKSLGIQSSESITSMSKNMLQLTSDLASFKDLNYEDVYKSLKSVIFGGQTRTGLNLGVDIYAKTMEKYASSVGKTWSNLSGAEKSALRLEKVMKDLKFMYGDFSNTSYTWANQTRLLKEQFSNLKAVIGENLIMVFNNLLIIINKVLSAISKLASSINSFLKSLGLGNVLESAGANIASALDDETSSFEDAANGVSNAGSNASKEIQRSLFGFDKLLNNLQKDSDNSSNGGSGSSGDGLLNLDYGNSDEVEKQVETLMSKAISNLKQSLKKVSKFFNVLWEDFNIYFAKPFSEFLQGENGIPRFINNIASLIDGIDWNKINVAFRRWFDSLEPLAEFIVNVGIDIQEYLINPLLTFFANNVIPSVINALANFNNAINWEKVRKGINNVIKALEPLLETIISIKVWVFEKVLLPIGEWFLNTAWPRISNALIVTFDALNGILKALQPYAIAFYEDFLKPVGAIIGEKIINGFEKFAIKLNDLKENINDETWVHNNFGVLGDDFNKLLEDIQNWDLASIINDVFKIVSDTISTANETFGISEKFNKVLGNVIEFGKEYAKETLIPKIEELWNNDVKPKISVWFDNIWTYIEPYVYNLIEKIVSKMVEVTLKLFSGYYIINVSKELGKAILGLFNKDVEDNTNSLGKSIVNGIIDGFINFITSTTPILKIKNAIVDAFTKATKNIKLDFGFSTSNSSNPNDTSSLWTNSRSSINVHNFANGGYVHATPGGVLGRIAEAGSNEIVAPEPMIRKIIREEMGNNYTSQPIILQLDDGSILGQYVVDYINSEAKRTGKKII